MGLEEIKTDYHLFIDIQMGKYLKSTHKSEFSSDEEAKFVIGRILQTWNDKIAHQHLRLDNSSIESKTSWFNSIDINYQEKIDSTVTSNFNPDIRKVSMQMVNHYNDLFPFLPKNSVMFLFFAGPALEAYGYSLERFNKLIDGQTPTEIEKDLLQWAYDISFGAMVAYLEKNNSVKDKLLSKTIRIAKEELDQQTAINVVAKIYSSIEEHFSELHTKENNTKSIKGKKK